ncbi:hypothetical protein JCM10213_005414 [Rhodosporidiobolus nylandii]
MATEDVRRYRLEENEALDGQQVVTVKDAAGKVIWTKTRELMDDEIVSTVFDSLHHPRWRISRPTQGWYLILQRVSAKEEPFIELKPAKKGGDLELVFTAQTPALLQPERGETGRKSPTHRVDMSPTSEPLTLSSTSMSASSSNSSAPLADADKTPTKRTFSSPPSQSSTFRLVPRISHTFSGEHPHTAGLLGKIKSIVAEPRKRWSVIWEDADGGKVEQVGAEERVVMAFSEQSSGFFKPHLSGQLTLTPSLVYASGLEPSFWIALCCAYADVVEEREGWEAAKGGD